MQATRVIALLPEGGGRQPSSLVRLVRLVRLIRLGSMAWCWEGQHCRIVWRGGYNRKRVWLHISATLNSSQNPPQSGG